ncbi:hypothetical protein LINPERHAP1_LOCUS20149 [Linum perenne]
MHIYREGNQATNFLASLGHSMAIGTHEYPSVDANLDYRLLYDIQRIATSQSISIRLHCTLN